MQLASGHQATVSTPSSAEKRVAPRALSWLAPFALRAVWSRAALVSLPVGLLQVGINQGEYWLRGELTAAVISRSLLTPLVTLTVALLAAASTYRCAMDDGRWMKSSTLRSSPALPDKPTL